MAEVPLSFDDGAAYERFMGPWSLAAGAVFLDWLAPPTSARWLDVGCGTGSLTELILKRCSPTSVFAIDPAPSQIERARLRPGAQGADFQIADAQSLPCPDATFDVVASGLVLNFVADQSRALTEMRRTTRCGGIIALYVWDFASDLSPSWPLRCGMRKVGADVPPLPGTGNSTLIALHSLFRCAGLEEIDSKSMEVKVSFSNFDAFWRSQTPSYLPTTKKIAAMTDTDRVKLVESVRPLLSTSPDGNIEYSARANAVKARVG